MSSSSQALAHDDAARAASLVDQATAPHLTGPEWQLNMAVCDLANANHAVGEAVVRALHSKLESESPRTVLQALVLVEAVEKNGPKTIHAQIGTRSFLNAVAALSDGSLGFDVQNQALVLIKQWADAFAGSSLAAFQDVYRQLKLQGVDFPELEHDAPVFTPPPSSLSASSSFRADARGGGAMDSGLTAAGAANGKRTREQQIAKLHVDLRVVMDKIARLRALVAATGASQRDELDDVLDFLRQCQPRMNTLIEGGIMGKIDEKTLETCLTVNDHLIKALEESRAATSTTTSAQSPDLISFDSPPRASRSSDASAMSRLSLQDAGAGAGAAPARSSTTFSAPDDDFDAFLSSHAKH